MKIYRTQSEVKKDIKNGVLAIEGDVKFECSISISASIIVTYGNINAGNITAGNITAGNINAWNINAGNITAGNITAGNITAWDINAWDINAWDINAWDITAGNINAWDINARDILYSAFCCVYQNIKCLSIKAKRTPSKEPICLEGKLEIKEPEQNSAEKEAMELLKSKGFKIIKE